MMKDEGVRLPGARRRDLAERNLDAGITISETLAAELERLAR
jgi:LDH2 family malate/lactate/ureidoglycolate dehydrogenase